MTLINAMYVDIYAAPIYMLLQSSTLIVKTARVKCWPRNPLWFAF